jgi:hypothetical protein
MENTPNVQSVMEALSAKAEAAGFQFDVDLVSHDEFATFMVRGAAHDETSQKAEIIEVTDTTHIDDIDWPAIEGRLA